MIYPCLNSFHLFIHIMNELWNSSDPPGVAVGRRSYSEWARALAPVSRHSNGVDDVR